MKDEIKEIFNKYGKSHYEDDYSLEFETYIVELKELKKQGYKDSDQGNHQELLKTGGYYSKLYNSYYESLG